MTDNKQEEALKKAKARYEHNYGALEAFVNSKPKSGIKDAEAIAVLKNTLEEALKTSKELVSPPEGFHPVKPTLDEIELINKNLVCIGTLINATNSPATFDTAARACEEQIEKLHEKAEQREEFYKLEKTFKAVLAVVLIVSAIALIVNPVTLIPGIILVTALLALGSAFETRKEKKDTYESYTKLQQSTQGIKEQLANIKEAARSVAPKTTGELEPPVSDSPTSRG